MDKSAMQAYWRLAIMLSGIQPGDAATQQAKQLHDEFSMLRRQYLAYAADVNGGMQAVCMSREACLEMMLIVVQDFIMRNSALPEVTEKAALAWKTLLEELR